MMSMIVDQPDPAPGNVAVWPLVVHDLRIGYPWVEAADVELVVADMEERDRLGRKRYGRPLETHNGRDALVDAYQEVLDGIVYLRQSLEERNDHGLASIYRVQIGVALRLRKVIATRSGAAEERVLCGDERCMARHDHGPRPR